MRRPGTNKTRELFADAAGHGDIAIRPPRSARSKRDAPFSIRFTAEERTRLELAAGKLSLGTYIKARLFDDLPPVPRQRGLSRVDQSKLGQTLAMLGQSRLSSNMNQIAKAANRGTLPLTPDLIDDLNQACLDIKFMRHALMRALGLKPKQ